MKNGFGVRKFKQSCALPISVYNIRVVERKPLPEAHGFCPLRAAEWQLDQPSWSGRLRITAKGQVAYIKLEDRTSGKAKKGLCRTHFLKGNTA